MIDQGLFEKSDTRQECKAVISLPGHSSPLALCCRELGAKSEPTIRLILQLIPKGSMIKNNYTESTFRKEPNTIYAPVALQKQEKSPQARGRSPTFNLYKLQPPAHSISKESFFCML